MSDIPEMNWFSDSNRLILCEGSEPSQGLKSKNHFAINIQKKVTLKQFKKSSVSLIDAI
jgi:hypothetical protein